MTGTVIARYFPVIVYRIPIYRQPFHVIRTMVAPLLICDFGTILVFRMRLLPPPHSNFNDRISALVTVLLALFAFLTYARSALPDVPVSTWMDTVIFQSIVMTCLGMLETFIAYETVHVLKPLSNTTGEDFTDETRRRLVSKGGSGGQSSVFDSDYEVFWPRGGESDWSGTDGAIWCHTTLRFLVFAVVIILWVSMGIRLYWRLHCFRLMVNVNADLLKTQSAEVKRKSTDFDPSTYDWPESTEFVTSVAANISRANDEDGHIRENIEQLMHRQPSNNGGIIGGIEHVIARRPSNGGGRRFLSSSSPALPAPGAAETKAEDQQQLRQPPSIKRQRSFGPGVLADPNEFSSPSMTTIPRLGGQGKLITQVQPFLAPIKLSTQPFTRTLDGAEQAKTDEIDDDSVGQIRLAASTEEDGA